MENEVRRRKTKINERARSKIKNESTKKEIKFDNHFR